MARSSRVCDASCVVQFRRGDVATLTALAETGFSFDSWSGDCAGRGASVSLDMLETRRCVATFLVDPDPNTNPNPNPAPSELTVEVSGIGTVRGADGLLHCESNAAGTNGVCTIATVVGEVIAMEAIANVEDGYRFGGWTGDCSGAVSSILVTMNAPALNCTANFTRATSRCDGVMDLPAPVISLSAIEVDGSTRPLSSGEGIPYDTRISLAISNLADFPSGEASFRWTVSGDGISVITETSFNDPVEVDFSNYFVVCENLTISVAAAACGLMTRLVSEESQMQPQVGMCP